MITVGIDPDLKASGVAVVIGGKLVSINNIRFPDLIEFLTGVGDKADMLVKLENPEANKGLFAAHSNKNKAVSIRVATNVGQVMAVARLLHEMLVHHGYAVKLVSPLKGAAKKCKDDAEYFKKITGWQGRSNADQRDAAMIAIYG